MRPNPFLIASFAVACLSCGGEASAADAARGRALYELHCGSCHSDSVHGRKNLVAKDFGQVRAWVGRWSGHLKLRWSDGEIDDVARHLNDTYYRHQCPPSVCNTISMSPRRLAAASR